MNIIENETPYLVETRTCGCNERGKSVSYHFVESSHSLCIQSRTDARSDPSLRKIIEISQG